MVGFALADPLGSFRDDCWSHLEAVEAELLMYIVHRYRDVAFGRLELFPFAFPFVGVAGDEDAVPFVFKILCIAHTLRPEVGPVSTGHDVLGLFDDLGVDGIVHMGDIVRDVWHPPSVSGHGVDE